MDWPGEIRMARDADGSAIGTLYAEAGQPDHGVDWQRDGLGGWWMVGERDGNILGALQVIASKPFGYIGEIVVHPSERGRSDNGHGTLGVWGGVLGRLLYFTAQIMLEKAGVQIVLGTVREDLMPTFGVILTKKYGGTDLGRFHLLGKRIT